MITIGQWDMLYSRNFGWAIRQLKGCSDETAMKWVNAMRLFYDFEKELFNTYEVLDDENYIEGLELTAEQLFEVAHKYISQGDNYTVKYFIFNWWNDLRHYVDNGFPTFNFDDNCDTAFPEETMYAREYFSVVTEDFYGEQRTHRHTFKDNGPVLIYRGIRFPIDDEWGNAWALDKDGNPRSFSLDWDWWYPIDEFLDLN